MESGKKEQNFWPGFVDALSNLVLTLVFVMVIFVLALFYLSSKVSKSKLDALCPETKAELAQVKKELADTREALRAAQALAGQVKEKVTTADKKPPPLKKDKLTTQTTSSGSSLVIRFPSGVVDLDDETKQALDKLIEPLLASGQKINASLNAVPGPETFSEGKRLSFFRNLAIRNYLISKGVVKEKIDTRIMRHEDRDPNDPEGRVMLELQRATK